MSRMRSIILIAHNVRSSHNVGSLLRTADGLGVEKVYLTGYTPYPLMDDDERLPHIAAKIDRQITKTSLGAEKTVTWRRRSNLDAVLSQLRKDGYRIVALEQNPKSINLSEYDPPGKLVLIVGREVEGIEPEILDDVDEILEIPMLGKKESFNVTNAAAMALYHLRFS